MNNRNTVAMYPHPLDSLDPAKLREKVIEKHLYVPLRDKSPEVVACRKRLAKLRRIRRLEDEACGEESW